MDPEWPRYRWSPNCACRKQRRCEEGFGQQDARDLSPKTPEEGIHLEKNVTKLIGISWDMDSQQYDIWVWKGVSWNSHVHVKCKDSPSSSVFFPSCFREPEMSDPSLGVKMGSIPSTSEQRGCEQIIYPSEKGCLHPIPIFAEINLCR